MKAIVIIVGMLAIFSCNEKKEQVSSGTISDSKKEMADSDESSSSVHSQKGYGEKEMGEINYNVSVLSAMEFIQRKGEKIADADRKQLQNERVVIFEIALTNLNKDILQSSHLQLTEEEVMNYMVGEIVSDFSIEQSGKSWKPTGVNFEGRTGAVNKLRVQLFMGAIDIKKPMKVLYYDRIMGQGLIKFGINE